MADIKTVKHFFQRALSGRFLLSAVVCAAFSCSANAESNMFLPSEIKGSKKDDSSTRTELRSLCNKQLAQRSEQIRSNQMSATHRALNHDWLASYSEEHRPYHGGRAFGRIAQKMLREYWEQKRHKLGDKSLLDEDGKLRQREFRGIDYGLTTSGGGLNFGLNYTFE
ncbi:MAG: hypothetical protein OIF34_10610 [Porticoccaceae bacterium]|nr:hypothetical protein [Porticoccaceae bacterium]